MKNNPVSHPYVDQFFALENKGLELLALCFSLLACLRPDIKKLKSVRSQIRKIRDKQELLWKEIQKLPGVVLHAPGAMICMNDHGDALLDLWISNAQGTLKKDTERLLTAKVHNRVTLLDDSLNLSLRHLRSQDAGRKGQEGFVKGKKTIKDEVMTQYEWRLKNLENPRRIASAIAAEMNMTAGNVRHIINKNKQNLKRANS